jgi:hypothetical protein
MSFAFARGSYPGVCTARALTPSSRCGRLTKRRSLRSEPVWIMNRPRATVASSPLHLEKKRKTKRHDDQMKKRIISEAPAKWKKDWERFNVLKDSINEKLTEAKLSIILERSLEMTREVISQHLSFFS